MKKIFILILSFLLSSNLVYANETSLSVSTNPDDYHCQWNSQSTYPVLEPSEITTVWIKFKNNGTETWYNYGDHPIRLGTSHSLDRESVFYKHTWISENRPATLTESQVKPGNFGTFKFYLKAPETPGEYTEYFQPVAEGITWMEDQGVFFKITVSGTKPSTTDNKTYSAKWNSQSDYLTIKPGSIQTVWVKFQNTGDTTWYNYGSNPTRLGTSNPLDRESVFAKDTWLSTNRPTTMKESQVKPNEFGTFEFYIKAPTTTGEYKEYFRPVIEGITWLDDVGLFWVFNVTDDSTDTPTNDSFKLTGSNVNNKAYLDWTDYTSTLTENTSGISGYKVVRSETKTNPTYPDDWWVYLSGTDITSYTDTSVIAGHTYYYRIGAYKSDSGVIQYTNYVQLKFPSTSTTTTSTISLSGSNQSNGVKLIWNKYTGSESIEGYKVLRSTTNTNPTYPNDYLVFLNNIDTVNYLDSDITNNQKYYYRIGAYKNGTVIAYSNTINITPQTTSSSDTFVLETTSLSNGIKLDWDEYSNSDIDGYKILKSTSNPNPTYPDEYIKYIEGQTNTTYTDTYTVNGQGYYYRIGAYKNGSIIAYSNIIHTDSIQNITDIRLEAENVNGGISLTWDEFTSDSISGYKLLRSTTNQQPVYDGTYYKYLPSSSTVGYVDTDITSNQKYYYRIGAYKNGEVISYSNTVTIIAD